MRKPSLFSSIQLLALPGISSRTLKRPRALKLSIEFLQANNEREIDEAFSTLAQTHADALLVGPGPFLTVGAISWCRSLRRSRSPRHMKPVPPQPLAV